MATGDLPPGKPCSYAGAENCQAGQSCNRPQQRLRLARNGQRSVPQVSLGVFGDDRLRRRRLALDQRRLFALRPSKSKRARKAGFFIAESYVIGGTVANSAGREQ